MNIDAMIKKIDETSREINPDYSFISYKYMREILLAGKPERSSVSGTFTQFDDPREDIYTEKDGKPIFSSVSKCKHDQIFVADGVCKACGTECGVELKTDCQLPTSQGLSETAVKAEITRCIWCESGHCSLHGTPSPSQDKTDGEKRCEYPVPHDSDFIKVNRSVVEEWAMAKDESNKCTALIMSSGITDEAQRIMNRFIDAEKKLISEIRQAFLR